MPLSPEESKPLAASVARVARVIAGRDWRVADGLGLIDKSRPITDVDRPGIRPIDLRPDVPFDPANHTHMLFTYKRNDKGWRDNIDRRIAGINQAAHENGLPEGKDIRLVAKHEVVIRAAHDALKTPGDYALVDMGAVLEHPEAFAKAIDKLDELANAPEKITRREAGLRALGVVTGLGLVGDGARRAAARGLESPDIAEMVIGGGLAAIAAKPDLLTRFDKPPRPFASSERHWNQAVYQGLHYQMSGQRTTDRIFSDGHGAHASSM